MKRITVFFLVILLLLTVSACDSSSSSNANTVKFYYCSQNMEYHSKSGSMVIEKFNAGSRLSDLTYLLTQYLDGPQEDNYISPFPEGTAISQVSLQDNVVHATLTNELASLTGADLTLACACLTLTILDITKAESVVISAESAMLNNADYITMDASCILLLDAAK